MFKLFVFVAFLAVAFAAPAPAPAPAPGIALAAVPAIQTYAAHVPLATSSQSIYQNHNSLKLGYTYGGIVPAYAAAAPISYYTL